METNSPKTAEVWHAQQRVVGLYGNLALKEKSSPEHVAEESIYVAGELSKYEELALARQQAFVDQIKQSDLDYAVKKRFTESSTVRHGYMVMGRIMSHASKAYVDYCAKTGRPSSVEEMAGLIDSDQVYQEFILYLSSLPNEVNKHFEENYSLTTDDFKAHEYQGGSSPFTVSEYPDGRLYMFPDSYLEQQANQLCPRTTTDFYGEYARCPATKVLLRSLWTDLVSEGATNPELFAADLAIAITPDQR